MVEKINIFLKVFAALCLQLLSLMLFLWVFNLKINNTLLQVFLFVVIGLLSYLFVGFSLSLIPQALKRERNHEDEILDEEEIKEHNEHDL